MIHGQKSNLKGCCQFQPKRRISEFVRLQPAPALLITHSATTYPQLLTILLDILTNLGITGYAWKWSYLEDRSYQVSSRISACLSNIFMEGSSSPEAQS
ncbi:hypothetical protein AOLI_G00036610 [Acnodon oligacanthus]